MIFEVVLLQHYQGGIEDVRIADCLDADVRACRPWCIAVAVLAMPSRIGNGVSAYPTPAEVGDKLSLDIRFADDGQELPGMKRWSHQNSPAKRTAMSW